MLCRRLAFRLLNLENSNSKAIQAERTWDHRDATYVIIVPGGLQVALDSETGLQ